MSWQFGLTSAVLYLVKSPVLAPRWTLYVGILTYIFRFGDCCSCILQIRCHTYHSTSCVYWRQTKCEMIKMMNIQ